VSGLVAATAGVSALAARLDAGTAPDVETLFRFCADAQITVAGLEDDLAPGFQIVGKIYENDATQTYSEPGNGTTQAQGDPFALSKSGVDPSTGKINVVTSVVYRNVTTGAGRPVFSNPKQFNCKMRTRESLTLGSWASLAYLGSWTNPTANNQVGFEQPPHMGFGTAGEELLRDTPYNYQPLSCSEANRRTYDQVFDSLDDVEQGDAPSVVFEDASAAQTGTQWTSRISPSSSAYEEPAYRLAASAEPVHIRSVPLVANSDQQNPFGLRLNGAFYCSLIAPDYLRDLLTGVEDAPEGP
jgi:hypothetical protein